MENRGFTLIELMVVVVIIGVLAAVAVPKLFGMVAKSKASEVGPAVGAYYKLQDAFASVKDSIGSWQKIGYFGPGTTGSDQESSETQYFSYYGAVVGTVPIPETPVVGWQASNKTRLNDCEISDVSAPNWKLSVQSVGTTEGIVQYQPTILSDDCAILTPLFSTIK